MSYCGGRHRLAHERAIPIAQFTRDLTTIERLAATVARFSESELHDLAAAVSRLLDLIDVELGATDADEGAS